jgi:hypothetical protein
MMELGEMNNEIKKCYYCYFIPAQSVAIVGASSQPGKIGFSITRNIIQGVLKAGSILKSQRGCNIRCRLLPEYF